MKNFKIFCLTAFLLYVNLLSNAQYYCNALKLNSNKSEIDTNKAYFNIENINFMRNNEYFNKIYPGYTLFGTFLNPSLIYKPHKNLLINTGFYIKKEFGIEKINIYPKFNILLGNNEKHFIFGSIAGNVNNNYIEPLYDPEYYMVNDPEYGALFFLNKPAVFLDGWINWEKAIKHFDNKQEHIAAGLSFSKKILTINNFTLSFPFQFVITHHGGQIDTSNLPLESITNLATGLKINKTLDNSKISSFGINFYYVNYKNLSNTKLTLYNDGDGFYSDFFIKTKYNINLMVSYWKSNKFITAKGYKLYQSVAFMDNNYTEKTRNIIFFRLIYEKKIYNDLQIDCRFEPFFDINNKNFEYSYSLFLVYDGLFKFKK